MGEGCRRIKWREVEVTIIEEGWKWFVEGEFRSSFGKIVKRSEIYFAIGESGTS